jgi:hypothetical protein
MTTKRKALFFAILVALSFFAVVFLLSPAKTPPSQKPLTTLSSASFVEFSAAFDEASGGPRLVLLFSPT